MPVRKSRRLMGEAPELVPDEFYMRESKPYIPPKPEKEQLLEIEGTIVFRLLHSFPVVLRWKLRCHRTGTRRRYLFVFRHAEATRRRKGRYKAGQKCSICVMCRLCGCRRMDFPCAIQWREEGGSGTHIQHVHSSALRPLDGDLFCVA